VSLLRLSERWMSTDVRAGEAKVSDWLDHNLYDLNETSCVTKGMGWRAQGWVSDREGEVGRPLCGGHKRG